MKIESNTYQSNKNNNAAKPSMEHHHSTPRYDLYPQYSNFPIRDSNNMHNNYTVPPALVQKKFPRVNERICNYDETYFNVASAQNPDLGSIGDSFFTDQSIRIIPYIPHKDLLSGEVFILLLYDVLSLSLNICNIFFPREVNEKRGAVRRKWISFQFFRLPTSATST